MIVLEAQVETDASNAGRWRCYGIGDPHLEKATHDRRRFRKYIRTIASDPHGIAICVGDVFDVTLPSHKFYKAGTQRADVVAMMDAYLNKMVEEAVNEFAPILQAGMPLIIAEGNHDIRMHGVNAIQLLVGQLNSRARDEGWTGRAQYAGGEALIRVRAALKGQGFGYTYAVYLAHGAGGGSQPGGKVNRATWQAHIADADIFLRGHVEEADVRIVDRYAVTRKGDLRLVHRPVAYYTAAGWATKRRQGVVDYPGVKSLPPVDRGVMWLEVQLPRPGASGKGAHGGRMRRIEADF